MHSTMIAFSSLISVVLFKHLILKQDILSTNQLMSINYGSSLSHVNNVVKIDD